MCERIPCVIKCHGNNHQLSRPPPLLLILAVIVYSTSYSRLPSLNNVLQIEFPNYSSGITPSDILPSPHQWPCRQRSYRGHGQTSTTWDNPLLLANFSRNARVLLRQQHFPILPFQSATEYTEACDTSQPRATCTSRNRRFSIPANDQSILPNRARATTM